MRMTKKKKNRNATGSDQEPGADQAAEITRLRAQNEKLQKQLGELLDELKALRTELKGPQTGWRDIEGPRDLKASRTGTRPQPAAPRPDSRDQLFVRV